MRGRVRDTNIRSFAVGIEFDGQGGQDTSAWDIAANSFYSNATAISCDYNTSQSYCNGFIHDNRIDMNATYQTGIAVGTLGDIVSISSNHIACLSNGNPSTGIADGGAGPLISSNAFEDCAPAFVIPGSASATGSITGFILTTTAVAAGPIWPGHKVTGTGVTATTEVLAQLSATTYRVNISQSVASTTLTFPEVTGTGNGQNISIMNNIFNSTGTEIDETCTTNTSTALTSCTSTSLLVGMVVVGTGIPTSYTWNSGAQGSTTNINTLSTGNVWISAIPTGTTVTLSKAATASAAVTLHFCMPVFYDPIRLDRTW